MASIVKRKNRYSVVYSYTDENGVKRQKYGTIPVMYSTDIPQEAQENTITACMWMAIQRSVFSRESR